MTELDAPLIIGPLPPAFTGPFRAGRWRDVLAKLGDAPDVRWPASALAACLALTHQVPRVVLAREGDAADLTSTITLDVTTPSLDDASFIPPGRTRPERITRAMLDLVARARPGVRFLPTVTVPRDYRAPAAPPIATGSATASATPPSTPSDPLAAALEALVRAHAFRLENGPAAWASLKREADRILREEVRARRIVDYALSIGPAGASRPNEPDDDGEAIAIEAYVRLPRRVRQVVFRVGQMARDGDVRVGQLEVE